MDSSDDKRDRVLKAALECRTELVAYARLLLGNYTAADDVCQEAMIVVVKKYDQFQEGTSMLAWCRSIVRIEVLRAKQRHQRERTLADRLLDDAVDAAFDEFQAASLWTTMCASGHMARYDIDTKQFKVYSSAEAPKKRGNYPHTLRINPKDPEGLIWYTDAGSNSCFSIHPKTGFVKEYRLLSAGQAIGAGRGESRGITPYGLDYSPVDSMIWYSKLNGNRIGRIDPSAPDGDIKEWNPPFRGPRRLHVAPDGMVWVPGFGSGVFGKFDPNYEKWTVYELPDAENQIPYALNVDKDGIVWICGTGNDTINRFDPKTETLTEFRLPTRVSYTREIEFDDEGNVWTSTSGPARHMERGVGAVIKISLPKTLPEGGGIKLTPKTYEGSHDIGNLATAPKTNRPATLGNSAKKDNSALFAMIDKAEMPKAYYSQKHQDYVDKRMASIPPQRRGRVGQLWNEFRQANPQRSRDGQMFVRIMEYVANDTSSPGRRFIKKWQHHYFGNAPDNLGQRNLERGKLVFEQATCSRCHQIGSGEKTLGPDLTEVDQAISRLKVAAADRQTIRRDPQGVSNADDSGRRRSSANWTGYQRNGRRSSFAAQPAEARQGRNDQEVVDRRTSRSRGFDHANRAAGYLHDRRTLRSAGLHSGAQPKAKGNTSPK